MKKILSLFILMLLPLMASAETVEIDGIYYYLASNFQEAEVTNRLGGDYYGRGSYSDSVNIPATVTYDGVEYNVTRIGLCAFSYCSDLTSITIPNSVTNIGQYAFFMCTGLTSVDIPNSVKSVGGAFIGCTGLTSVKLPNELTIIGDNAFYR